MSSGPGLKYMRCGACGAWTARDRAGVYRHRAGDGSRCNRLLAGKIRTIGATGRIPARPLPAREYSACLFCGLVVETYPGGLCPACMGKRKVEEESA